MIARVNINVTDIRRESKFRSERTSQALFNEQVEISDRRDSYCRVKTSDNYSGWIGEQFISELEMSPRQDSYVVTANLASAYCEPDAATKRITSIPYGCRISGASVSGFVAFKSERYGDLFVPLDQMEQESKAILPPEERNILTEAEKFLGTPYLWGGRSFFGIDCSGFVQTIMRRFGVELPRDSKDQREIGQKIDRQEIRTGDLLFFPGHATLALSKDFMIHSSSTNGGVAYNSLDPGHPLYSRSLDDNLIVARRVFG